MQICSLWHLGQWVEGWYLQRRAEKRYRDTRRRTRESKSERNVFTIAKQVFKDRAVRCPGISSWALGFENHIVTHCIMRKSSAWEVSFCVRSSQITMGVSRCQTCFGDCGRIRYMTYSHKTNWVDECPSRHRVISSTHVLPLAWPCSDCVVRLHGQSLSCVFTITSDSECLWNLRSCCCDAVRTLCC